MHQFDNCFECRSQPHRPTSQFLKLQISCVIACHFVIHLQVDAKGHVATILEVGVKIEETVTLDSFSAISWQSSAPLYGPDICPNGCNLGPEKLLE